MQFEDDTVKGALTKALKFGKKPSGGKRPSKSGPKQSSRFGKPDRGGRKINQLAQCDSIGNDYFVRIEQHAQDLLRVERLVQEILSNSRRLAQAEEDREKLEVWQSIISAAGAAINAIREAKQRQPKRNSFRSSSKHNRNPDNEPSQSDFGEPETIWGDINRWIRSLVNPHRRIHALEDEIGSRNEVGRHLADELRDLSRHIDTFEPEMARLESRWRNCTRSSRR